MQLAKDISIILKNSAYKEGSVTTSDLAKKDTFKNNVRNNLMSKGTNFRRLIHDGLISPEENCFLSTEEMNRMIDEYTKLFNDFIKGPNTNVRQLLRQSTIHQLEDPAKSIKIIMNFDPNKKYSLFHKNPSLKSKTISHTLALEIMKYFSLEYQKVNFQRVREIFLFE